MLKKLFVLSSFMLIFAHGCHPAYAYSKTEAECLAQNVYFEARNESTKGQLAVAFVVLNRVKDKRYPNSICEVVYQGPTRPSWKNKAVYYPVRHRCQFSWYCDGKSDKVRELTVYNDLYTLMRAFLFKYQNGFFSDYDFTKGATHYHADYVRPGWAASKTKTITIGTHIFYRWEVAK